METIQQINPSEVTLLTKDGPKVERNPLEKARDYAFAVKEMLERDPALVGQGERFRGKLLKTYAYGVVFANITRKRFEAETGFREVFPSHLVICQDEFYERVPMLDFRQRLWKMLPYQFGDRLTAAQIDRVRWHLYPDVRIADQSSVLLAEADAEVTAAVPVASRSLVKTARLADILQSPDLLWIMDIQQERLARSLGAGHRVIHGVAGSGKTMILVHRCLHLAQQMSQPILVLCFNVSLAAKLNQMLAASTGVTATHKTESGRVIVQNFHQWCSSLVEAYRVPPLRGDQSDHHDALVQRVILAVEEGRIPVGQYGAVLIDEGHDFEPSWLKLAAQMVDPETNSLLLLYDDAQNIYKKRQRFSFSFKSVGIQAQGRTDILKLN